MPVELTTRGKKLDGAMGFAPSGALFVITFFETRMIVGLALNFPATIGLSACRAITLLHLSADLNLGGELSTWRAV